MGASREYSLFRRRRSDLVQYQMGLGLITAQ
jgi:hypothetical protein